MVKGRCREGYRGLGFLWISDDAVWGPAGEQSHSACGAVTGETGAERWQACSSLVLVNVVRAEEGHCLL